MCAKIENEHGRKGAQSGRKGAQKGSKITPRGTNETTHCAKQDYQVLSSFIAVLNRLHSGLNCRNSDSLPGVKTNKRSSSILPFANMTPFPFRGEFQGAQLKLPWPSLALGSWLFGSLALHSRFTDLTSNVQFSIVNNFIFTLPAHRRWFFFFLFFHFRVESVTSWRVFAGSTLAYQSREESTFGSWLLFRRYRPFVSSSLGRSEQMRPPQREVERGTCPIVQFGLRCKRAPLDCCLLTNQVAFLDVSRES